MANPFASYPTDPKGVALVGKYSTNKTPTPVTPATTPTVGQKPTAPAGETPAQTLARAQALLGKFQTPVNTNTLSVASYKDLPGGITQNTLSDGTNSFVKYTKNADGSLTPTEVPEPPARPVSLDTSNITSSMLGGSNTTQGILSQYQTLLTKQQDYQNQLLEASKPTAQEQDLTRQINDLDIAERQGLADIENKAVPLDVVVGEQANVQRQANLKRQALASQLNVLVNQRSQQVNALQTVLPFTQQNFTNLVNLQKLTQPETIGTQINKATGEVFAFMQDPSTGKITTQTIGNVGAETASKAYTNTGTYENAQGQQVFYGVTPDGQIEQTALGNAKKAASTGTGGSNQTTDNERALLSTFQSSPIVKTYNDIVSQKLTIDNIVQNGVGGPADLAMVFGFMKGLDPNSVVRETEYATAANSGNIFAGKFAKFNGYMKEEGGFLPVGVRNEFQNLVNQRLDAQQRQYENYASAFKGIAERQGLNPDNVVVDFSGAIPKQPTTPNFIPDEEIANFTGGAGTPSVTEQPKGFFNRFLNIFGM